MWTTVTRGLAAVAIVFVVGLGAGLTPRSQAQQLAAAAGAEADPKRVAAKGAWSATVTCKIDDIVNFNNPLRGAARRRFLFNVAKPAITGGLT